MSILMKSKKRINLIEKRKRRRNSRVSDIEIEFSVVRFHKLTYMIVDWPLYSFFCWSE